MSTKQTFSVKIECRSCGATGLYKGMGEALGAAVVCHTCRGTGCEHLKMDYRPFTHRQDAPGVKKVFQVNMGWVLGPDTKGGLSYDDWRIRTAHSPSESPFSRGSEDREHTCPCWYWQRADSNRRPNWRECYANLGQPFDRCPSFTRRNKCWERFDKEGL